MAIQGTLDDLSVLDLVQFVPKCRQDGALEIRREHEHALFFYEDGRLVHVEAPQAEGLEALASISGWAEGSFQFRTGLSTPRVSIDMEIPQAILAALQIVDERHETSEAAEPFARVRKELESSLARMPWLQSASVFDAEGMELSAASRDSSQSEGHSWMPAVKAVLATSGAPPSSRVFFECESRRAGAARLDTGEWVVLRATADSSSMGALSVALTKVRAQIAGILHDVKQDRSGLPESFNEFELGVKHHEQP